MLTNIKDIITIITLLVGSYVGLRGLKAWKTQLKGNQDHALAKSLMISVYKYKEALIQLRHPAVWSYEYPEFSREDLEKMSHQEKSYQGLAYAYRTRWDKVITIKPVLYEMVLESQVLWGDGFRDIVEKLFKLEFELMNAISSYIAARNPDKTVEEMPYDSSLVFDSLSEDDQFRLKLKGLIKAIEDDLKPRLKL